MASDQELADARTTIAALQESHRARVKSDAVAAALGGFDLVSGAASQQVAELIAPSISVTKGADGREVVFGPNYKPLDLHVAEVLSAPEFGHFLKQKESPAPTSAGQTAVPEFPIRLPAEVLGVAMIRRAMTQGPQPAGGGDPRMDPSQPLALGGRSLRRK